MGAHASCVRTAGIRACALILLVMRARCSRTARRDACATVLPFQIGLVRLRVDSKLFASMSAEPKTRVLYENLDTSFVNLWALLRTLTQRGFIGRVRVELKDYTADVFMTGSNTPLVHEIDRAAGTDTLEEAALHRLVLRARGAPGSISVFEGADEVVAAQSAASQKPEAGAATISQSPSTESIATQIPPTESTATIRENTATTLGEEPGTSAANPKPPVRPAPMHAAPE